MNHNSIPLKAEELNGLLRQPQFLAFYNALRQNAPQPMGISYSASPTKSREYTLKAGNQSVSFLLDKTGERNMLPNLDYFRAKSLPGIASAMPNMPLYDFLIDSITLKQWNSVKGIGTYNVSITPIKQIEQETPAFIQETIQTAGNKEWLKLWMRLNSLYKILAQTGKYPSELIYLEALQAHTAENGSAGYRRYDGTPKLELAKPIDSTCITTKDPRLKLEGKTFVCADGLTEAVLFSPEFYREIFKAEKEGRELSITADSDNLLFAEWLK